jgi:hypothetical protein
MTTQVWRILTRAGYTGITSAHDDLWRRPSSRRRISGTSLRPFVGRFRSQETTSGLSFCRAGLFVFSKQRSPRFQSRQLYTCNEERFACESSLWKGKALLGMLPIHMVSHQKYQLRILRLSQLNSCATHECMMIKLTKVYLYCGCRSETSISCKVFPFVSTTWRRTNIEATTQTDENIV